MRGHVTVRATRLPPPLAPGTRQGPARCASCSGYRASRFLTLLQRESSCCLRLPWQLSRAKGIIRWICLLAVEGDLLVVGLFFVFASNVSVVVPLAVLFCVWAPLCCSLFCAAEWDCCSCVHLPGVFIALCSFLKEPWTTLISLLHVRLSFVMACKCTCTCTGCSTQCKLSFEVGRV